MGFKYKVCDINLISDIAIPALKSKEFNRADIQVIIGPKKKPPNKTLEFLPGEKILYKDVCKNVFLISRSEIVISLNDENAEQAAISLLGIPLGFALHYNNYQVLHGSAISSGSSTVCFVGKSGAGKSSLAMALVNRGLKLVTEDLCVIKNSNIYNFSNWLKTNIRSLPIEVTYISKMPIKKDSRNRVFCKLSDDHVSNVKSNIKAVYFLKEAECGVIKKLGSAESFKHLFTYAYRKNDLDEDSFKKIAKMSKDIMCFSFSRDTSKPLEENAELIFNHLDVNFPGMF